MEAWRANLYILLGGSLVASASYSMVIPFLPLFLVKLGIHQNIGLWSGIVFSSSFLAGALISPVWGALADRYGRRPMLIRSGIALTVLYAAMAFVKTPVELLLIRVLMGLLSGYIPSATALIGSTTPKASVGFALASLSTATATGSILGPLFGGILSHAFSYQNTFLIAGASVAISTLLAIIWVREPNFVPSEKKISIVGDFSLAVKNRGLLTVLIAMMITSFAIMTIEPLLPLYVIQLGVPVQNASLDTGIVFSVAGLSGIVFGPIWGRYGDRKGFRRTLLIGLLGGSLGNIAQIFFHSVFGFGAIRFFYGMFFCAVYPALNALTVEKTDDTFRGRAFGISQTFNQMGTLLGPLIGGYVGDLFHIDTVFVMTGTFLLIVAIFVLRARSLRASSVTIP
ncbi:MFS transporter [Ferroacidibacillus organovorans]|uniref:MFS transporter n=1 Tax=Ferroacidibacillus organovorans TaxID=1765683 RepID=A0A124IVN5_9BACL|nr:MFS transporter [Ferroacidibacillus organovorans]KUO94819.1 MFS transporter [Ferroacidibacillus organovorans]